MQSRNLGLDIVRTAAILPVASVHYLAFAAPTMPQALWPLGTLGVTIFFALSGFLIGRIMLRSFQGEICWKQIRVFYLRRWFRTLPLYYTLLLAATFVGTAGFRSAPDLDWRGWLYIPFLQNFAWQTPLWFAESWSLAVEEWFYLLFPLAALFLKHVSITRRIAVIAAAMASVATATRAGIHFFEIGIAGHHTVITSLDQIAIGVLAACLQRAFPKNVYRARWPLLFLGLAATTVCYLATPFEVGPAWFRVVLLPSILSASIASAIIGINAINWLNVTDSIFRETIYWISSRSYALYLCHGLVIRLMIYYAVFQKNFALSGSIYIVSALTLTEIVHRSIETPFMKRRPKE